MASAQVFRTERQAANQRLAICGILKFIPFQRVALKAGTKDLVTERNH